jgi:histone H3/H4
MHLSFYLKVNACFLNKMEDTTKVDVENLEQANTGTSEVENKENDEHGKNKKKKTRYFETYISKVLKTVSAEHGITANARQQLNSAICVIAKMIANISMHLTVVSKKKTMSEKEVGNAVKLVFCGTLTETASIQAEESLSKFKSDEAKHSSRQDKAGILFPPSISEKFLRNFGFSKIMVTKSAPVYFAAILEHLTIDILTTATKMAKENNRVRVTIRDLELTIRTDKELAKLFEKCNLSFVGGGVVPQIHETLLNKKPRKKRKNVRVSAPEPVEQSKKHRFRPGTVSLREIRKFQKISNCLTFAKFPFERFIRNIVNTYNSGMKISKDVFIVLQYYVEQFVVDFLRDANSAAIHSGRVKLMPSDINFICQLRKYDDLDILSFKTEKKQAAETDPQIDANNHIPV